MDAPRRLETVCAALIPTMNGEVLEIERHFARVNKLTADEYEICALHNATLREIPEEKLMCVLNGLVGPGWYDLLEGERIDDLGPAETYVIAASRALMKASGRHA